MMEITRLLVGANDSNKVIEHGHFTNTTHFSGNGDLKPSNAMDQPTT